MICICQNLNPKFFWPFIICFVITIVALFISTLIFCLCNYKFELEINDPNIDLSRLGGFRFNYISTPLIQEYDHKNVLGYTGKPIFDCFKGECQYYKKYPCEVEICEYDEDNQPYDCKTRQTTCSKSTNFFDYYSSNTCRNYNGKYCDTSSCNKQIQYDYKKCACTRETNTEQYSNLYSCTADNVIFNWKNNYYSRGSSSEFNYLNNAFPSNQNCPNGMKQCGILDELGNKLCLPSNYECPINNVTLIKPENNYKYENYTIDGVTIYYTNDAKEDGRVLGGFYVDTDLMINYNIGECQIISTGKISELLKSHKNILYKDSLNFNPYKDKNIDEKGKAYLKWCIPGVGKERNITKIKELMKVYELNKTANSKVNKLIDNNQMPYFMSLSGLIGTIISLLLVLLSFKYKTNCGFAVSFIFIMIGLFFFFGGSISSIFCQSYFSDLNKLNLDRNIFKVTATLNIIAFCLNLLLLIFIIGFYCKLCKLLPISDSNIYIVDNNYNKFKDKNNKELEKKYDDSQQNNNKDSDSNAYDNFKNNNQPSNTYPLTPDID